MAEAGRMGRRGMPRNLLDLALLARTYDEEAHAPFLGRRLQRIVLAPLVSPRAPARRTVTSAARDDDRSHDVTAAARGEHGLDPQPAAPRAPGQPQDDAPRARADAEAMAGSAQDRSLRGRDPHGQPARAAGEGARVGDPDQPERRAPDADPQRAPRRGARSGRAPRAAARGGPPAGARSGCGRGRGACGPRTS